MTSPSGPVQPPQKSNFIGALAADGTRMYLNVPAAVQLYLL